MENSLNERAATPLWHWVTSGLALAWNAMGIFAYLGDVKKSPEEILATYGSVVAEAWAAQPAWVTGAYAIAVFAGALGCLLLLLRSRFAIWALLLSLFAVIAQQVHGWFLSGVMGTQGAGPMVMYILILLVAIFLVWYARKMTAKGVLK